MTNPKFHKLIKRINWYPPYLGMGIRVTSFRDDFTRFDVDKDRLAEIRAEVEGEFGAAYLPTRSSPS